MDTAESPMVIDADLQQTAAMPLPASFDESRAPSGQPVAPVAVGVLLDARIQERWVLESVQQALTVPGARLAAVALAGGNSGVSVAARLHRLLDRMDEQVRCPNERLFASV